MPSRPVKWCPNHRERFLFVVLRCGIWLIGFGYLWMEAREVVATRQITNLAVFALLFALASYQQSTSRWFFAIRRKDVALTCAHASNWMFLASLMAVGDAAQDVFIASLVSAGSYASLLPVLFAIGWVCNLFAVLLALWSMEIYLPVVFTNLAIKQIPSDE